ncbi:MAG: proton-conducting transporter membrane subunit [Chloroflexota bacterium]
MNAPLLWIILPGAATLILYALRRWQAAVHLAALALALLLALLAWRLPVGEPIELGLPGVAPLVVGDTLTVLGRRLVLENGMRPVLALLYLAVSLWLGGAYAAAAPRLFVPFSLAIAALVVASLAVRPTLYAALFIQLAALVAVPLLSPPGKPVRGGVLRFLIFQTVGMSFVLFADYLLNRLQSQPEMTELVLPATLLFGLGFALTAAIFPFHTWVPMLAEESHPYAAAFIFFFIPSAVAFIGLDYLRQYSTLSNFTAIQVLLRSAGALMCLVAGVWAAFENRLERIMGFAALVQVGMGLLAISLGSQAVPGAPLGGLFFAQLAAQCLGLAVWSQALAVMRRQVPDLRFRSALGLAQRLPIASMGLVLANFSLAGLPLLASFPGSVALWSALTGVSLPAALLSLVGNACLFAAGMRTLAVLVTGFDAPAWSVAEEGWPATLLILGILLLLAIGMTPQWLMPALTSLALP